MERLVPFRYRNWDRRSHGDHALPNLHRTGRSLGDPFFSPCSVGVSTGTKPSCSLPPSGNTAGNGVRTLISML